MVTNHTQLAHFNAMSLHVSKVLKTSSLSACTWSLWYIGVAVYEIKEIVGCQQVTWSFHCGRDLWWCTGCVCTKLHLSACYCLCSVDYDSVVWSTTGAVQELIKCVEKVFRCFYSQETSHKEGGTKRPHRLLWPARKDWKLCPELWSQWDKGPIWTSGTYPERWPLRVYSAWYRYDTATWRLCIDR